MPDAKISSDPTNKMLIVTASEEDHKRIQAVLDQADKRGGAGELVTKAYTLRTAYPYTHHDRSHAGRSQCHDQRRSDESDAGGHRVRRRPCAGQDDH